MTKKQKWLVAAGLVVTALAGTATGQIVGLQQAPVLDYLGYPTTSITDPSTGRGRVFYSTTDNQLHCLNSDGSSCLSSAGGGGTVTNIATTGPISGGPITTTGTISCPTCTTSAAAITNNVLAKGSGGAQGLANSSVTDNGTTVSTGEQIVSTLATGTAPFSVASTTNVANLNASSLSGATFASPGTIGGTTPGIGDFTTLNLGVLNTTAGVITGFGSTSGTATITWPAVAGTATNQIAFSNAISAPNNAGNNPGFSGTGSSNQSGLFTTSSGEVGLSRQSSALVGSNTSARIGINGGVGFTTCTSSFTTCAPIIIATAPTIAAAGCGGSGASITAGIGTAAFNIGVGTGPTSAGCTVTMPAASTGWNCSVNDMTTVSTTVFVQKQTGAISTTSVTFQNFSDVAAATAPSASDVYHVVCMAY